LNPKAIEKLIFALVGILLALFLFVWDPMELSRSTSRWIIVGYIVLYVIYRFIVDINKSKKGGTD
jgi:cell division protein FtsW (lipid II flippase)